MAAPEISSANQPLRQIWSAVRGQDSILHDRPFSITALAPQSSHHVGARLSCFAVALGLTITIGLAGTTILNTQDDAAILVRHMWGGIGALLGVALTVAVTRSELRAAVLLLLGGVLSGLAAIVTSLPALVRYLAPGGRIALGGYFVIGAVLGIALGCRAAIAYRRAPSVTPGPFRAAAWKAGFIVATAFIATFAIYWLSQKTQPGVPDSNAMTTALVAAVVVGIVYHFVAPPQQNTSMGAEWRRLAERISPIVAAGPIASWLIPRSIGEHGLPYWVDGLAIGCLAGLFLGYMVDLLERPFAGRRHVTAMMTIVVVAILPALRLLAFDHTSAPGIITASVGALFGLIAGGALVFATVQRPDHDVAEPDHPELELMRHVVLFLSASPAGLDKLEVELEARAIRTALAGSRHPHAFDFQPRPAARFSDLEQAVTELAPTVVHLSGHADEDHFYFYAPDNLSAAVPIDAIVNVFRAAGSRVKVVVVNACKSARLAGNLVTAVDFAVGMTAAIDDRSARTFAEGFYRALGDGKTVATAYFLGKNTIRARELPGPDVPCDKARDPEHPGEFSLAPIR